MALACALMTDVSPRELTVAKLGRLVEQAQSLAAEIASLGPDVAERWRDGLNVELEMLNAAIAATREELL